MYGILPVHSPLITIPGPVAPSNTVENDCCINWVALPFSKSILYMIEPCVFDCGEFQLVISDADAYNSPDVSAIASPLPKVPCVR